MKEVKLTQGKYALVDDEDFEWLNQWKWCINSNGYAVRDKHISGSGRNRKKIRILMHRFLNNTPDGLVTDHINANRLDNRKSNLRTLTASENIFYSGSRKNNTSGYKGVSWSIARNKWCAQICKDRRVIPLGRFEKLDEAIRVRKLAEKQLYI